MSRPGDWSPLRGSDPTPGEPETVGDQARHYGDVASELRAQISRLRRIGGDAELKGQYADKLREAADELVGDLQKVERRYARVAAALRRWEPQLRDAQRDAERIRTRGQGLDDERRLLLRQSGALDRRPRLPDDPTPAQQARFDADQAAAERIQERLEQIEAELRRLDRELGAVEDRVRSDGRAAASNIRAAVDDDISDTTWEDIKGSVVEAWRAFDAFIDDLAPVLKKIVEALQYVTLALAVVALFIPGLNVLVAALTIGIALTQGVLYATGNATAADLAFAVFALLTLGAGSIAGKVIQRARNATVAAAAPRAGARAAASARAQTQAARAQLGRQLGRRLQPAQRARTRAQLDQLQARTRAEAQRRAARAEAQYLNRAPMQATPRETLLDAGVDNARYLNDIARTRRQFPVADVVDAGRWATPALHVARGSTAVGAGVDAGTAAVGQSNLLPDKPFSQGFEDWKSSWAGGSR